MKQGIPECIAQVHLFWNDWFARHREGPRPYELTSSHVHI